MNQSGLSGAELDRHDSEVLHEQQRRFEAVLAPLPKAVRELRMGFVIAMVFNSLARYAGQVASSGLEESRHALLVEQLVAAAVGALLSA
jgi:hypothetical protein